MAVEFGEVQMKFAELIWEREPIGSGELVKLCAEIFDWKKSTTYTVLKKLCDKGLFQNVDGVVTSRISKEDFYTKKSEEFVDEKGRFDINACNLITFAHGAYYSLKEMIGTFGYTVRKKP